MLNIFSGSRSSVVSLHCEYWEACACNGIVCSVFRNTKGEAGRAQIWVKSLPLQHPNNTKGGQREIWVTFFHSTPVQLRTGGRWLDDLGHKWIFLLKTGTIKYRVNKVVQLSLSTIRFVALPVVPENKCFCSMTKYTFLTAHPPRKQMMIMWGRVVTIMMVVTIFKTRPRLRYCCVGTTHWVGR